MSLSDELFVKLAPSLRGPKSRAALLTFSCPEDTGSGISCSWHLGRVRTGILLMGSKGRWQCLVLRGGMTPLITEQSFMRRVLPSGICQPMRREDLPGFNMASVWEEDTVLTVPHSCPVYKSLQKKHEHNFFSWSKIHEKLFERTKDRRSDWWPFLSGFQNY